MWPVLLLGVGVGALLLIFSGDKKGGGGSESRPPAGAPPRPPPGTVHLAPGSKTALFDDAARSGKPVYFVEYVITGTNNLGETFLFASDAQAEVYYRLLHGFFAQPIIYRAYTNPIGEIMVSKAGTPPAKIRSARWTQYGPDNLFDEVS